MAVVFVVACSHDYSCILELQISAALLVEERVPVSGHIELFGCLGTVCVLTNVLGLLRLPCG